MSQSSSAPAGAALAREPVLPPLVASLKEEGEKSGLVYNWWDPVFIRKIEVLAKRVPREYEIVQAFRAFAADHARGCTPFYFDDRFSKYHKVLPAPARAAAAEPPGPWITGQEIDDVLEKAAQAGSAFAIDQLRARGIPA